VALAVLIEGMHISPAVEAPSQAYGKLVHCLVIAHPALSLCCIITSGTNLSLTKLILLTETYALNPKARDLEKTSQP
jgi:hypothetical protein